MNPNIGSSEFSQVNTSSQLVKDDQPKDQIELFFSILDSNLVQNKAYFITAEILTKKSKERLNLGQTNIKNGGPKIDFGKSFIIDYFFEMKQTLNISVFQDNTPIVTLETTIGKIMGSKLNHAILNFNANGVAGNLKISGVPIKKDDTIFTLGIKANFGQSKIVPYYIVKRNASQNKNEFVWIMVYKSEVLINYPNVQAFNPISLSTQFLCNGDINAKPVLIEFFDANNNQPIGGFCAPLSKMVEVNGKQVNLMSPTGGVINDKLMLLETKFTKNYKFLDYIHAGTQISSMVAIDFTSSNGKPNDPTSLHSIQRNPNLYEMALESCCSIISNYDNDQLYPVFGYGAKIVPNSDTVSHCFPVNMTDDPNIKGVDGILKAYRNFIQNPNIKFHGPTYFAPIIKLCSMIAKNVKNYATYSILTILTDGMINDWEDTVDAIIEASKYPISIIIIGMGPDEDDDFAEMKGLDSDNKKLINSNGVKAARDIVQFVEFDKLKNDPKVLSEKVLEEIPRQFEEYFRMVNVEPGIKTG